jgi:hypothetical protein
VLFRDGYSVVVVIDKSVVIEVIVLAESSRDQRNALAAGDRVIDR